MKKFQNNPHKINKSKIVAFFVGYVKLYVKFLAKM